MADKDILQMLIDKLDRHEDKLDKINEKLTEFELHASKILTSHELEIDSLKKKFQDLEEKDKQKKEVLIVEESKKVNWFVSLFTDKLNRFILALILITIIGADKLKLVIPFLR